MNIVASISRMRVFGSWITPDGGGPSEGTQVQTYTEDTVTDFNNPERGWYTENMYWGNTIGQCNYTPGNEVNEGLPTLGTGFDPNDLRLELFYYDLAAYRNATIPQSVLDDMAADFSALRASGKKCVLRFAYERNDNNLDEDVAGITDHFNTLLPTITANQDVIAVLQGGFVGPWGEQWVDAGYTQVDTPAERAAFIDLLMNNTPSTMQVQWRQPFWFTDSGEPTPTFEDRFDGTRVARLGHYNDCIGAGPTHVDTYTTQAHWDWAYAVGPYTAMGGESCNAYGIENGYDEPPNLFPVLTNLGIDYKNAEYYIEMKNNWFNNYTYEGENALSWASKRLGYRLVLNSVTVPETVSPGGSMEVTISMSNVGMGKVYNKRPIDIVFVGTGGPFTMRLTEDARRQLPLAGTATTFSLTGTVPAGLSESDTYDLYLRLPDPAPSITANNKYAIRLANTGIWDGATGRHNLNLSVSTGGSTSGTLLPNWPGFSLDGLDGVTWTSTSYDDYPVTPRATSGDKYVDASVPSSGDGNSLATAYKTLNEGLAALSDGQRLIVKGDGVVYNQNVTITRGTNWATGIEVFAYGDDRPILDWSGMTPGTTTFGINFTGSNEHWKGFEVRNTPIHAIRFAGANNWVEDIIAHDVCYAATDSYSAFYMFGSGAVDNLVQDCVGYRVGPIGGDGTNTCDVFTATTTGGPGNYVERAKFVRCVGSHGPDDVFDFFLARNSLALDCVAAYGGYHYNDGDQGGDGNNFKLGGAKGGGTGGGNTLRGAVSVYAKTVGVTVNGADPHLVIDHVTTVENPRNIILDPTSTDEPHIVTNVLAIDHTGVYNLSKTEPINDTFNSWNVGVGDGDGDFPAAAKDWSLGATSPAIGAGTNGENLGGSDVALAIAKYWLPIIEAAVDTGGAAVTTEYDIAVANVANPYPAHAFYDTVRAFPTAEGAGANAKGPRAQVEGSRSVRFVTNLADSGEGSFRDAIEPAGAAYVIPLVSGIVQKSGNTYAMSDDKAYLGNFTPRNSASARLKGLALRAWETTDLPTSDNLINFLGNDIIVRYLRMYRGYNPSYDGTLRGGGNAYVIATSTATGLRAQNVIIDHCNAAFSDDQLIGGSNVRYASHSHILAADPIHYNSYHEDGGIQQDHGYGPFFTDGDFSFFNSVIANVNQRAPTFSGDDGPGEIVDIRQILAYNNFYGPSTWGEGASGGNSANIVRYLNRDGPITRTENKSYWWRITNAGGTLYPDMYMNENSGWRITDFTQQGSWDNISYSSTVEGDVRVSTEHNAPTIRALDITTSEMQDYIAHTVGVSYSIDPDTGELVDIRDSWHANLIAEIVADTGPTDWIDRLTWENRLPTDLPLVELVPSGTHTQMVEAFWSDYFEPWAAANYAGVTRANAVATEPTTGYTYIELYMMSLTPAWGVVDWNSEVGSLAWG